MRYCEKCNKQIKPGQETYRGLCLKCYEDYLLKKIELIGTDEYEFSFRRSRNYFKEAFKFVKNFFQRKK